MSADQLTPSFIDGKEHQVEECTVVVTFSPDSNETVDAKALFDLLLDAAPVAKTADE